jgi:hypothetical protein
MASFLVRRWPWIAGAAAVAVVVAVPLVVRARGRAHLAEAKARLVALGLGGGLEDLRREAPPVDAALQARWRRAVDGAAGSRFMARPLRWRVADWMNGGGPEPEGARAAYEADGEILAEAAGVLAEGQPVAGILGSWVAGGAGPVHPPGGLRFENLLGVKNLASLFFVQAAFEADPGPSLGALDRMHAAFGRPGCLLDAMIGIVIGDIRDETYARLAAAGRLPGEAGDRWLAEEPVEPERLVRALRGERLFFLQPLFDGLESGTIPLSAVAGGAPLPSNPARWLESRGQASGWWLHGSEAAARILDNFGSVEAALGAGRPVPAEVESEDAAGRLASGLFGNLSAAATSALMGRQRHRMARAFVRACRRPRGELREGVLLGGGPADFPVLLALPAPGRVRVTVDVNAPVPCALSGLSLPGGPIQEVAKPSPFLWRQTLIEAALPDVGGK